MTYGRDYDFTPRRPPKHKDAPIFTEQRGLAVADAMSRADLERIHAEAVAFAAEALAAFERRTGR